MRRMLQESNDIILISNLNRKNLIIDVVVCLQYWSIFVYSRQAGQRSRS